ncbi:MAG: MATE family efflux transporter [Cytophagales bacterium]|nr:MATE family efflux transporter [Cytophagales bacterium]
MEHTKQNYIKQVFLLAYPVSLGQLGHILTNVADSIMLGKYNSTHLAASSFSFNVFLPFFVMLIGLSLGITPLIANTSSENVTERRALFNHSFYYYLFAGIILTILCSLCIPYLSFFGQEEEIVDISSSYLISLAFSLFPIAIFQFFKQYIEGMGHTKPAMFISIGGNLINIVGNFILIYGSSGLGIPALGLEGAGYSTLFSRVIMAIAMYTFVHQQFSEYFFIKFNELKRSVFNQIHKISFPISLQMLMEVGAFAFTTIMVGWLSKESLVAHQIAISMASISYIVATGISSAMTIKIGEYWGKKDKSKIKRIGNIGLLMVLVWMGACMLIFWLGSSYFPLFYVQSVEKDIISMTIGLVLILGVFQLPDGIQVVCSGILRGMNDVNIPMILGGICYWVITIPLGYLFAFTLNWGVQGIWWGFVCGLFTASVLLYLRFRKILKTL